MEKNRTYKKLENLLVNLLVTFITLVCIFPVIWVIYSSFKTDAEFFSNTIAFPHIFHFENYIEAFVTARLGSYFLNSAINSFVCVTLICLLSFFIGFFISRLKTKIMRIIYYILLAGMLIPVHGLLVPTFIMFKNLDFLNKIYTLWFPYIAFGLPMAVFLVESFVRDIPIEIEEAAYIDGCNIHQLIFKIVIPICKPVFATIVILSFLNVWNEFPYALVLLSTDTYRTIPIGLTYFTTQYSRNWTQMMAGMVIASAPIMVVYLFLSKRVMAGMTAGAVKG